ncbi:MAG: PKD domain-containing protein, partial [Candidatus Thermoplasmatota archaeon]|nr:PKD domain-containing protein [Candidatus Thermoplasmatota archaeon]MBU1940615.1 PKD domain-containing protein [Candidatus Thermoplasmatota archaeon]
MKQMFWRKGLVLGIIILFFGASITPSISGFDNQLSLEKNEKNRIELIKGGLVNLPDYKVTNTWYHNGASSYFDAELDNTGQSGPGGNYDIWDGIWFCWCVDQDYFVNDSQTELVELYCSYDPNIPYPDNDWPKVNWIFNNKDNFPNAAIQDFQDAIWYFIDGGVYPSDPDAQAIVNAAENHGDFIPQIGDIDAVLLYPVDSNGNPIEVQRTCIEVTVRSIENPTADFTWSPQNPNPGQSIFFDASASYDPNGYIISYEWDWNNDGIYDESHTFPTTTRTWSQAGNYPVTLRVTDNASVHDTITKNIQVGISNQPPVTRAGGPYTANMGVTIYFDGSNSYDPDGTIIGYRWDFTNDGSWDTGWSSSPYTQKRFYSQFHGKVKLGVKDNHGATQTGTAKLDIGKPNQPPVASFSWSPTSPQQGQTITFDASSSYDPDGTISKYEWDWNNDGSYDISKTTPTATHSWNNPGNYKVSLKITDNSESTKIKNRDVSVTNAGPPPFNPPRWVTVLISYTSAKEKWMGDHYYVKIPMKSPYLIPVLDCSIPITVTLPWPLGGAYLGKTDAFSSYIEVNIYPDNPQKNTYKAKSYAATSYILIPVTPKLFFRTVIGINLNDGSWDNKPHDVYIRGEIKYNLKGLVNFNTLLFGFIPVTINIDFVFLGGLDAGIKNPDDWIYSGGTYTNVWDPEFYVGVELICKAGLGLNFGSIWRASVGVYGKGGVTFYIPPPRIKLSAEFGVYGELGPFEGRWAVLGPWSYTWPSTIKEHSIFEKMSNFSGWELIPRDYDEPQWQGEDRGVLIKEMFPFAQPSIASQNNKKMMVWVYDDQTKNPINGYELNYSHWTGNNWSSPQGITDDNYNEMYPSVTFLGNNDALVVFNIVDSSTISTLDDYFEKSKIGYCYYDSQSESWSPVNILAETPEFSDSHPTIMSDGNTAVAVWTCDVDKNIFTIDDVVTYASFWDGGLWHNTRTISDMNIVSYPISLDYHEGVAAIAYAVDQDGNLSTVNDKEIYITTFNETQTLSTNRLTNDALIDSSPSIKIVNHIPVITWIKEYNNETTLYYQEIDKSDPIPIIRGNISLPSLIIHNFQPLIGWYDYNENGLYYTQLDNGSWITKDICKSDRTIEQFTWDYTNYSFSATYIEKDNASSKTNCSLISIYNS